MDFNLRNAITAFQNGKPVIIMDDEERENEGDLCLPAEYVEPEDILFFLKYTTGSLCIACNPLRIDELRLKRIKNNTDPNGTPFTVSVDLKESYGTTTGVSAFDRSKTIKAIANEKFDADAFTKPGHIQPLRASPKGLIYRQGHTEASVELCKIAGVYPACMIAELMFREGEKAGEMMRLNDCIQFGKEHNIPVIRIQDILLALENPEALLPIKIGNNVVNTRIRVYNYDGCEYITVIKGNVTNKENVFLRVHSECVTGDIFRSEKCDCGYQLQNALKRLENEDCGVIIYIKGHEGRGIGIHNKIKCYSLQDKGNCDTVVANTKLYLPPDDRSFDYIQNILNSLNIKTVILHTNNPKKINSIHSYVGKIQPFDGNKTLHNQNYLIVKHTKLFNKRLKIGLVYTSFWHKEDVDTMVNICRKFFNQHQYEIVECAVPGSYELVRGAQHLIDQRCSVVIVLGILLKGETDHYKYIAKAVSYGLMKLQLSEKVSIVNGLLTCLTLDQIKDRVSGPKSCVEQWCQTAITMANI
jgi:3,4-dihydroxy 2-butanone 4-phosphate synthase/GTP cyclohydrolase II